jgi:hypothetical protein
MMIGGESHNIIYVLISSLLHPVGFVTQPQADPLAISWVWFTASAYSYVSRLRPTTYPTNRRTYR